MSCIAEAEASTVRRDVERQINDLEAPLTAIQERKEAAKDDERRAKYELTGILHKLHCTKAKSDIIVSPRLPN